MNKSIFSYILIGSTIVTCFVVFVASMVYISLAIANNLGGIFGLLFGSAVLGTIVGVAQWFHDMEVNDE